MSDEKIMTHLRVGAIKPAGWEVTDEEFETYRRNQVTIAAMVARTLRPDWPITITRVQKPISMTVCAAEKECPEERLDFIHQVADAVSIAVHYEDVSKDDFDGVLFAECYLEDPLRAVELYVERRDERRARQHAKEEA
jgi:hypothetical protein